MAKPKPPSPVEDKANAKKSHSLSFIQPKDTKRTIKARSPRRMINVFRVLLPLLSLFVFIALILWPVIKPNTLKAVILKNAPDLVIDNLHFTGLTTKNEPYSISANKATRPSGVQNIYDLDRPQGEITLANGAWVAGNSLYGRYDQDSRKLWLGGEVRLYHDKGYQFTSDEAQIDINENYAWGDKPVLIQGNFGEIRGQGFRLLDDGHTMIVKGPAHALLSLHGGPSSDKPKPDQQ